jgi:hypothetical protein
MSGPPLPTGEGVADWVDFRKNGQYNVIEAKFIPPLIKGVRGLFLNNLLDFITPLVPLFQGGNRPLPSDNLRQIHQSATPSGV